MTRYFPSRRYLWGGVVAWAFAAFSGWVAVTWTPAIIAFSLFLVSSGVLVFLALRPPIEVRKNHLVIGSRAIPWADIRRVDRTGWLSPLIVRLTLVDDSRVLLIYPGDLDSSNSLIRHLRRHSCEALIDGVPYKEFWGEDIVGPSTRRSLPSAPVRVLRPEDEAEVERLYQRLKTVGRLDPKNSTDEK